MFDKCKFYIGQLVEYRSWYNGEGAWESFDHQVGIVLEIIKVNDKVIYDNENTMVALYDLKIYWFVEQKIEKIPDLLLCNYGEGGVLI